MQPSASRPCPAALLVLLLAALPAPALVTIALPLKRIIADEPFIFAAVVDRVDPDKPAAVFKLDGKLKGEPPFDRLPVNLTGDPAANKKEDHRKLILDRLEPGRKLLIFAHKRGKRYEAMGFVEGTWFALNGAIDADGKTVRWAFQSCEPYLRRTFKGTTAELRKVVEDALAKRAEPPPLDEKEPPGYGPPIKKRGMRNSDCGIEDPVSREPHASASTAPGFHSAFPIPHSALLGVIPSFVLVGPLAVVAALFPGVFARLAVGMRRWRAFLVVASVNGTLAVAYYFLQPHLPERLDPGPRRLTIGLLLVAAVGLCWAGRRYRRMAGENPALTGTPGRTELMALAGLTVLTGLLVASVRFFGPWNLAVELPMREFTFITVGLLVATLYAGYRFATRSADRLPDGTDPAVRLSLSGESVGLGTLIVCGAVVLLAASGPAPAPVAVETRTGDAENAFGPRLADVRVFELPDAQHVMSGVTAVGDRLYVGAGKQTGFGSYGFVFRLDRDTGMVHWKFDADEELKPVFCTPTVADGRVYFGEGLHTDRKCGLYCLDAATGKPAWGKPFATASHTEGTPRVVGGRVYFTAGDDGLFCADAATGERRWQFEGHAGFHIDGPPAVAGNRVFVGSGLYTLALLCVDADSGKELWRTPVNLRSFGTPLVLGNRVVYGLGTGNLTSDVFRYGEEKEPPASESSPAGAVVCVAADTGKELWRYDLGRSVHTPLAADAFSVYATSRDGAVHCLDRKTGKLRWKTTIGATITAGPAVAAAGGFPVAVYAVSTDGMMVCLNPQTGKVVWGRSLREHTGKDVEDVFSTPTVVTTDTPSGSRRVIYVGGQLRNRGNEAKAAAVFRFEDELGE